MKRVLIDLEENGCTVKEAVDYLKGLGYEEDDDCPVRYDAAALFCCTDGIIDSYNNRQFDGSANDYCKKYCLEKLTIKEKPIVFSNPLMQDIGREVVVNDGRGDFTGWVFGVNDYAKYLLIDIGMNVAGYTHNGLGTLVGDGTLRWFKKSDVKFVNEDGSLSDE